MIVSVISTLSYLQSVGMAHRDLKPANKFLMENGEIKIIDFGESKDYFKDCDDGGVGTMATIRGTPQYLSPILWKAHVEDGGNTRHVVHNLFKSDVYSCGLIFFQLASMEDVTGYNQKNAVNDGERLVEGGLKKLQQRYSNHIIEIIRLMLKFDESERPSFIELAKLVLTSTENTLESPKSGPGKKEKVGNKSVSKAFSSQSLHKNKDNAQLGTGASKDASHAAAKTPYGKEPSKKSLSMAKRGDSAKSGPNGLGKNLNLDSAQPGESHMSQDSAALERMQSHQ
jgi:serine/threonine protein kinase